VGKRGEKRLWSEEKDDVRPWKGEALASIKRKASRSSVRGGGKAPILFLLEKGEGRIGG